MGSRACGSPRLGRGSQPGSPVQGAASDPAAWGYPAVAPATPGLWAGPGAPALGVTALGVPTLPEGGRARRWQPVHRLTGRDSGSRGQCRAPAPGRRLAEPEAWVRAGLPGRAWLGPRGILEVWGLGQAGSQEPSQRGGPGGPAQGQCAAVLRESGAPPASGRPGAWGGRGRGPHHERLPRPGPPVLWDKPRSQTQMRTQCGPVESSEAHGPSWRTRGAA